MLQRSVTLIRRLSWMRPNVSSRGVTRMLPYRQHALDRQRRPPDQVRWQLHARGQIEHTVAQLFERVAAHVRTLAAVAVLVLDEVELLMRRQPKQGMRHAALRHHDELVGIG